MIRETPNNEANVIGFTFTAAMLGMALSLGVFGGIVWHLAWYCVSIGSLFGVIVFVWRVMAHDDRGWRIIETYEKNAEEQSARYTGPTVSQQIDRKEFVYIDNEYGRQWIFQPEPGAFAAFIRTAIDESNRKPFSQNQAIERKWTGSEYRAMVEQLKAVHWLSNEVKNGAPVFYDSAMQGIYEWLSMREQF